MTDKSPFFIRPYHVREEDKVIMDNEMKRLCYMGILTEGFSAYSSPVMLISRKLTKSKGQAFKCENSQKQLGIPISQRHFFSIGKFKMQGIVCIGSKRCLSFTEIIRKVKEILWNTSIFWQFFLICIKEYQWH